MATLLLPLLAAELAAEPGQGAAGSKQPDLEAAAARLERHHLQLAQATVAALLRMEAQRRLPQDMVETAVRFVSSAQGTQGTIHVTAVLRSVGAGWQCIVGGGRPAALLAVSP